MKDPVIDAGKPGDGRDIFSRILAGEPIRKDDPEYPWGQTRWYQTGTVVSKNVAPNTIVGSDPAKTIWTL